MKNLPLIFAGIFATLAASWLGIIFAPHLQFGNLTPTTETLVDPETGAPVSGLDGEPQPNAVQYPLRELGQAARGKEVYIEMGCMYCHTQQVRRKGFGADYERNWGKRQTVARDYIRQERVLLGTMRTGPDLANVGVRLSEDWHHKHLFNPQITSEGSIMPPFAFLYTVREIPESGPTEGAFSVTGKYSPGENMEIIPSQDADDLVAYLMSLRIDYDLPEAQQVEPF